MLGGESTAVVRMEVPEPGPHGGDGRAVAIALGVDPDSVLDLSLSMNPVAPDVSVFIRSEIDSGALSRYPDALDVSRATDALAERIGVDSSRVVITSGGSEAIALVAAELGSGWANDPDFSLYWRYIPVMDPNGPLFRSDPNNPTGLLATSLETTGDSRDVAACEVWDEAFYPLATGKWSRLSNESVARESLTTIVLGSLTKLFACPGLRLGYVVTPPDDGEVIGHPGLSHRIKSRQPQWSVATPSLCALPDLVAIAELEEWSNAIKSLRRELVDLLVAHRLSPRESDANFVLLDDAHGLRADLARRAVIVRDCRSFGLPGSVRIAVTDSDGLERLDDALMKLDRR